MDKENIKSGINNFAVYFSFNLTIIIVFYTFLDMNIQNFILSVGVIINLIVSKIIKLFSYNPTIEKYFCSSDISSSSTNSMQLLGFLSSYLSVHKYITKNGNGWMGTFSFMLLATILLGRIYYENNTSIANLISYWFLGFILGLAVGMISGNMKSKQDKENIIVDENSPDDKTCNSENNQDYVCQAFKDGKVFESL